MTTTKFALLLMLVFCVEVGAQDRVGMIVGISGTGRLRNADKTEQKLTTQNFAVTLSDGQAVMASGNGQVQIMLCNGATVNVRNKWYRVSKVLCPGKANSEKQRILRNVFAFGGRYSTNRADEEFILFPLEKEVTIVRPETAILRWRSTTADRLTVSIAIVGEDKPIWQQEIRGGERSFTSGGLKKVLDEIRTRQPNARLRLRLNVAFLGTENSADFHIFSLADEKKLQKELEPAAGEQGIFKNLARAEIYSRYKLYNEVADEYERALSASPQSPDLLIATASAHDRAGNFARRDEIDEQLKGRKKVK